MNSRFCDQVPLNDVIVGIQEEARESIHLPPQDELIKILVLHFGGESLTINMQLLFILEFSLSNKHSS